MDNRTSAKAKNIHTKLLTDLSNYISPVVNQIEYDQFQNRLRDLLKPIEQKQSKNIMDMLEFLEKRGKIAVGKYDVLRDRLAEFDVRLVDMIDGAMEEIAKIENPNVVSSNDSSVENKEPKDDTVSPNHEDGASPKKRRRTQNSKYEREGKQRGLMLIINFQKDRFGSEQDVEKIRSLFETELKFDIEVCQNLTKDGVLEQLEEFQNYISFRKNANSFYCFFIVIMGHGKKDCVLTADDDNKTYIEFDQIFSYFKNDKVKAFAGKPRVFLIQSCRGNEAQGTVDLSDEPPIGDRPEKVTIPIDSDILVAHSTTPGYRAYRRPASDVGAWFVDAFIDVCRENYKEEHLEEMLISVRERVACDPDYRTNKGKCQMPCVWTTLTKRLYLEKPTIE